MSAAGHVGTLAREGSGGAVAHALRRLWHYIRHNQGHYALCVGMILAYTACFVAIPRLVGWAIDGSVKGLGDRELARRCLWLLAVVGAGALTRYFSRTMVFNAAREVEYEIRNDLFAQLQRLPQSFYAGWRTGDLMSRCVNDLNSVRLMLGPGFLSVAQTPLLFVFTFGMMASLDPLLAVLVFVPYPAFVFIARAFGRALHQRNLDVQVGLSDLSNHVQETVSGISVVKAYAMEGARRTGFDQANDELLRRHLRLIRINGAMPAITGLLPAVAMTLVLGVGGRHIAEGRISVADFFTFAMYIFQLTFPTFIMGWVVALVQRGAASMQRIDEVLSVVPEIRDQPGAVPMEPLRGDLRFQGVGFTYPGGAEPALEGLDLEVPAGSSLGIVGPVGSGKTTLVSLVSRLIEPTEGRLLVDGVDITTLRLASLRRQIAAVPQDPFLFSVTLAENIAFGRPDASREEVEAASRRAQLHGDIQELPHGYDTVVGERGVMLSGGQRQRAALARALLLSPRILVLDDTLSAVDAETEAAIQSALREVFFGRTVLVVASRVSSVQDCDRIAVLDRGRLVEVGSHGELLSRGGLYSRLAQEQAHEGEERLAESPASPQGGDR